MSKKRSKILLLGSELGKGGAERSISLLSYYLEQLGYNVTLCLLSGTDRTRYYKTCSEVIFVDPPAHQHIIGKVKSWIYRFQFIKKLKRERNIDISVSFLEGPDYINLLTRTQEKVFISIRGSKMFDGEIAGIMGTIRKKILIPTLYQRADKIICVTHALAYEMKKFFRIPPDKLTTIYNFYEVDIIRQKSLEPLTSQEAAIFTVPVIIASGRLHMQKEFDKLLHVLAALKKRTEVRLIILGDGDKKQELLDLSKKLSLTPFVWNNGNAFEPADVYFMGYQSNAFKFYKHSKVFALSSSWEGFPNVLAEALICGLPVVATDCYTGPREILNIAELPEDSIKNPIKTPVGTLLPLLNPLTEDTIQYWTDALMHWLSSPIPSYEQFQQIINRFTLDQMLKQWEKLLDS